MASALDGETFQHCREHTLKGLGLGHIARMHCMHARLAARREHAAPIIAALKPWLEAQRSRIPQKSQLAEDIRYTLGHWPGLIFRQSLTLDDGTLELDTNPVENQIRPIALTRKNALFAGNEIGAENWAMLASLVIRRENRPLDDFLTRLILQDVEREPGRLSCHHPALHPRRPPAERHRRPHSMALQPAIKPRRIGSRRCAYTCRVNSGDRYGCGRFSPVSVTGTAACVWVSG